MNYGQDQEELLDSVSDDIEEQYHNREVQQSGRLTVNIPFGMTTANKRLIANWLLDCFPAENAISCLLQGRKQHVTPTNLVPAQVYYVTLTSNNKL